MAKPPKISIITVVFNGEKDIEQCIMSVASQHYPNKEHLIVDGLSTDKTMEIVRRCADQYPHIRWISEKDNGIYDAMNKGVDLATGEWIHFLGCDDTFHDNEVLSAVFEENRFDCYDVIYGNVLWGDTGVIYDGKFSRLKLMLRNICQQAIFHNRALFEKTGKFDVKYRIMSDHDFNMKWFNDDNVRKLYIDKIIAVYGVQGISTACLDVDFAAEREAMIRKYFPKEYSENYSQMRQLEREFSEQQNFIDTQTREIVHLQQQNERKASQIAELENIIADIYSSLCWRITAPLRKIHTLFQRTS